MIGKFKDSFSQNENGAQQLPQEIIDILNAALPDNFTYIMGQDGHYKVAPKIEKIQDGFTLRLKFDLDEEKDAALVARLKSIPQDKWGEYLYRTQITLPIKEPRVGNAEKVIPIEKMAQDPLSDNDLLFTETKMSPSAFPNPIKMTFESPEGDIVDIHFQQQAYDSLTEIQLQNIDFPPLSITLYQYSPLIEDSNEPSHTSESNQVSVTYSVTPTKAASVQDAITALHLFRGFIAGTTKVDGITISPEGNPVGLDSKAIEEAVIFWETALLLEQKLKISFDPGAEFPPEDVKFFAALKTCLIEGKEVIWQHPFTYFHASGIQGTNETIPFENIIGNSTIRYEFEEGPLPFTLLGAEFNLFSRSQMQDFVITNIEWDDKTKQSGKIYITDAPNKQWTLSRLFMTEEDVRR